MFGGQNFMNRDCFARHLLQKKSTNLSAQFDDNRFIIINISVKVIL